ncbi:hypothetical protein ACQEVI_01870 [Promicromonospora sp. CA-289599]|uniref:hypothetical protein n=1 Tax=Promicromonospora sp. CA-289599 TaxID=3240014 RepID=UPI003D8E9C14
MTDAKLPAHPAPSPTRTAPQQTLTKADPGRQGALAAVLLLVIATLLLTIGWGALAMYTMDQAQGLRTITCYSVVPIVTLAAGAISLASRPLWTLALGGMAANLVALIAVVLEDGGLAEFYQAPFVESPSVVALGLLAASIGLVIARPAASTTSARRVLGLVLITVGAVPAALTNSADLFGLVTLAGGLPWVAAGLIGSPHRTTRLAGAALPVLAAVLFVVVIVFGDEDGLVQAIAMFLCLLPQALSLVAAAVALGAARDLPSPARA